jgi:hypothetical protein
VPIIHELLSWSVTRQGADRGVLVGQAIGGEVPPAAVARALTVRTPAGRQQPAQLDGGGAAHWSYGDTVLSGVYTLTQGDTHPDKHFAVNVDPRESDLTRIDSAELPPELATSQRSNLDDSTATAVSRQTGFHRWLLYLVFGLLLAESLLAWRFGNSST